MHSGKPQKAKKERGREGGGGAKCSTGSNEPQKYFGRSDHVEALSQLRPLRSRKGMSQLGIPKMRRTSQFLRHKPSTVRCGHLRSQSRGTWTYTRSTGPRGRHSAGSSRVGTKPNTLMDMRTDLIAVPHAGLGFHFLRVQRIAGTLEWPTPVSHLAA